MYMTESVGVSADKKGVPIVGECVVWSEYLKSTKLQFRTPALKIRHCVNVLRHALCMQGYEPRQKTEGEKEAAKHDRYWSVSTMGAVLNCLDRGLRVRIVCAPALGPQYQHPRPPPKEPRRAQRGPTEVCSLRLSDKSPLTVERHHFVPP